MVLLDCSKLQLGRGRLDDSVSAFRRRLEVFRELSLPLLKSLDNDGRLTIVSVYKQWYNCINYKTNICRLMVIRIPHKSKMTFQMLYDSKWKN